MVTGLRLLKGEPEAELRVFSSSSSSASFHLVKLILVSKPKHYTIIISP